MGLVIWTKFSALSSKLPVVGCYMSSGLLITCMDPRMVGEV